MFKEKVKGFVAGVIVTTLMTTTVFAAPIYKTIKVYTNGIKVFVDSSLKDFKDAKGKKLEPFVYNGDIYLPISKVAQALGKNYKWDGKTNSVYIGNTNNSTADVYLDALDDFNFQYSKSTGFSDHYSNKKMKWDPEKDKDSTGKNYSRGIKYQMDVYSRRDENWQFTEYLIDQNYKKIKGTFVLHYDSKNINDYGARLKIYGDDNLLYTSDIMKAGVLPINFDVDLTGVMKLKVQLEIPDFHDTMDLSVVNFGIVNVGLYK